MIDWSYDAWPSGEPYDWKGAGRGNTIWDAMDFHVDLGCGTIKKGRIGIDHFAAQGVNIVMDLNTLRVDSVAHEPGADAAVPAHRPTHVSSVFAGGMSMPVATYGLPFADSSIESIISHHCLEHIGDGFIPLIDDCYRVLKPGGILRAITPLFPSKSAVEDPDHRRYFMEDTWLSFCGHLGDENNPTGSWLDSFSVPYTKSRFSLEHKDITGPPAAEQEMFRFPMWPWAGEGSVREIRVALKAVK